MKKKTKITIISIVTVLLLIVGGVGIYVYSTLSKLNTVETSKEDLGIKKETDDKLSKHSDITNIALFGIDAPEGNIGRSDSIMILTIDKTKNELKVSSIMRDSYVDIPGHGMDKINHAFAYGDSVLALKTINQNFDLNIDKFVAVNFTSLPTVIDAIGGIDINITEEEFGILTNAGVQLTGAGVQHLNGADALEYSRIRYAEGGDFQRTSRHRTILMGIFQKAKTISPTEYPSLLNTFLPLISTNVGSSELLSLGNSMISVDASTIKESRFPEDTTCEGKMIDDVYYLTFDKDATTKAIHNFIFNE